MDRGEIEEGVQLVETALRRRRVGSYQLQAAIAAVHAGAESSEATDWAQIAALYGKLAAISPTSVVALNRAVAIAMSEGLEKGLALMDENRQIGRVGWLLSLSRGSGGVAEAAWTQWRCRDGVSRGDELGQQ